MLIGYIFLRVAVLPVLAFAALPSSLSLVSCSHAVSALEVPVQLIIKFCKATLITICIGPSKSLPSSKFYKSIDLATLKLTKCITIPSEFNPSLFATFELRLTYSDFRLQ
ncbi:hypothetical protein PPACK8108_LOCUS12513 [Phakopsora pachyrhizi]|uniref:Secreted protein n=1 Tax=Phakopsora pachyrhizi TaxID=170000 RepID=A0AAV0B3D3_PHAPC|nr:hypothetical protein PPACK8108_LOCUS12513 [Phakopsora pachyrhizi]